MPTTKQSFWRTSSQRDERRAGRDVEHRVGRAGVDARDEEAAPARVLPEREHGAPAVVAAGRAARRACVASIRLTLWRCATTWSGSPPLAARARRGGGRARGRAGARAAPLPRRARRRDESGAGSCSTTTGAVVERRDDVRDTASIVAMCELAERPRRRAATSSSLRSQLAQVRMVEQPPGIEEAEEAALALERVIGAPPRVATPAYPRRGRRGDPRARAGARRAVLAVLGRRSAAATGAVDEFVQEVERGYLVDLRYRGRM